VQCYLMSNSFISQYDEPETPYSEEFWNNYTLFLVKQGISKKQVGWYVLRTKQYIGHFSDVNVREHTPDKVNEYFQDAGRKQSLNEWQFVQLVDAIRLLFSLALKIDWAVSFDWDYWKKQFYGCLSFPHSFTGLSSTNQQHNGENV